MKKRRILVVGSFVMDQIAETSVFPREGQTVLGNAFHKAPGGKGANQAVQMARLGADVTMIGKLGHDANGQEMLRVCKDAGIDVSHVLYDDERASGCAVIVLEKGEDGNARNRIIVIPGSNMSIQAEEVAFLKDAVATFDMVVLQLEIPMEINRLVARYAFEKGVPVMLNSAPSAPLDDDLLRCLSYISPNEHEAEDLTGVHIRHDENGFSLEDAELAARKLHEKGVEHVLITMGSAGALLYDGSDCIHAPCAAGIRAVDPTAAGDSFVGAFCVGVCCGWSWDEILTFANHAAGITVSGLGAMPSLPTLDRVEKLLLARKGTIPDTSALRG